MMLGAFARVPKISNPTVSKSEVGAHPPASRHLVRTSAAVLAARPIARCMIASPKPQGLAIDISHVFNGIKVKSVI